jgi:hypothetical protein
MNLNKIPLWIGGAGLALAGSLLIYFESYRNNELISGIGYFGILLGWVYIHMQVVKGTPFDEETNEFLKANPQPFKKRLVRLSGIIVTTGVLIGNVYLAYTMANARRSNILQNGVTDTAVATVGRIEARRSKSSTSYYAVFIYTVNGKEIFHPRYEHEGDFSTGQQFQIRYSVDYPEMFKIIRELPPAIN